MVYKDDLAILDEFKFDIQPVGIKYLTQKPADIKLIDEIGQGLDFGDLDDSHSEVRRLIRGYKGFRLHPECDTDPSVYYIDKGRRGG